MTTRLRRVAIVVFLLFISLFVSTSLIQGIFGEQLNSDPRNSRAILDGFKVQRGSIVAGNQVIAQSDPVDNQYRFTRSYPGGEMYSAVTGWYSHSLAPTGIEGAENLTLTGTSRGQTIDQLVDRVNGTEPRGSDVVLTIDPAVQKAAWDALGDRKGAAVAMDPSTGRILAMVSKPGFDAAKLADNDTAQAKQIFDQLNAAEDKPLVNRAIGGDTYPPGSTFKLIMSAAALENGYTPESTFPNPGSLTLTGTSTQIFNVTKRACGNGGAETTLKTALQYSCNIPFAELGAQLGEDKVASTAKDFGFGENQQIPLDVTASRYPTGMSTAQLQLASFGQYDVRVTPLQVASISATIGNKGARMQPGLIDAVRGRDLSVTQQFSPQKLNQALSAENAQTLTSMMVNNVSSGEISGARIDGVEVAGKTGTAETTKESQYNLWFTGFAPANDPKVAVAVVVEEGGAYGDSEGSNRVAAPMAQKIMKAVLDR